MSLVAEPKQMTIEEFRAFPDHAGFELHDGELVEINVSSLSSRVAVKITTRLDPYCCERQLGEVFGADMQYSCFPDRPDNTRKPDVSFVRRERLPVDWMDIGIFAFAPDLAVEVLSPNDLAYKVAQKIREYLDAGVKLVWEVNPDERSVRVHRADGTITRLKESETIDGEDVIPGFNCRVAEFFPA